MRIQDLSPEQRPRERLLAGREDELSDADLLALIWGTGTRGLSAIEMAQDLLARNGGLNGLMGLGPTEWAALPGIGPAKAGQVWAALELSRRSRRGPERPRFRSPMAAGHYLMDRCQGWTEERFGLLALNARGTLLAERIVSRGNANTTLASPREFFREALRFGAVSAIAFHNHPSGEVLPSQEDALLTRKLRDAGETLGIPLLDHLIVGANAFHSFRTAEAWAS